MVLVHEPFVPTPDSKEWHDPSQRYENDTAYFKDMVAYTDKIIGRIIEKLDYLNIKDNTLLLFTGDNGTHPTIYSYTRDRKIRGAKGNTINDGVHVPLIAYWPEKIQKAMVIDDLIEFSDFFPTFADMVNKEVISDGQSFYPLLDRPATYRPRKSAFVHYDPRWGKNVNQYRNQFAQTKDYKLYQNGLFYDLSNDILEATPLSEDSLSLKETAIKSELIDELGKHSEWDIFE
jgi:arylsulfatase A